MAANQLSKGQRKSFSARKTIWASNGADERIHPKNPTISKSMWGQLSDMLSCIFALKLRIYDSETENRDCVSIDHTCFIGMCLQQKASLQ
jgi:hypothetical protein